jgi:hypothetical protein
VPGTAAGAKDETPLWGAGVSTATRPARTPIADTAALKGPKQRMLCSETLRFTFLFMGWVAFERGLI